MNTMHRILLTVLGVLLGTLILASPAMANHSADFTYDTLVHYGSGTTHTQDDSYNPDGDELTIAWDCIWDGDPDTFQADQTGPTAACYYERSMLDPNLNYTTFFGERVTAHGFSSYTRKQVTVYPAEEQPGGLTMETDPRGSLPRTFTFSSNKPNGELSCNSGPDFDQCEAEPTGVTGPDTNGRYHHSFLVPAAAMGEGTLKFESFFNSPDSAEVKKFPFTVTGNEYDPFGGATHFWDVGRISDKKCRITRGLSYYAFGQTSWKVTLNAKQVKNKKGKKRGKRFKKRGRGQSTENASYFSRDAAGSVTIPIKKLRGKKTKFKVVARERVMGAAGLLHATKSKQKVKKPDCL